MSLEKEEFPGTAPNVKPLISAADETWLKGLDPEDRVAGLACVHYKRVMGNHFSVVSRPKLFMEAFQLGCAATIASLEGAAKEEKKTDDPVIKTT